MYFIYLLCNLKNEIEFFLNIRLMKFIFFVNNFKMSLHISDNDISFQNYLQIGKVLSKLLSVDNESDLPSTDHFSEEEQNQSHIYSNIFGITFDHYVIVNDNYNHIYEDEDEDWCIISQ